MIDCVKFEIEGKSNGELFKREEFLKYLIEKKKGHIGRYYAISKWITKDKEIEIEYKNGFPCYNWDGIVFLGEDRKIIIICNSDGTVRFKVQVPQTLVQRKEYDKHFALSEWESKEIDKDYYIMKFERFDDYFEYEGKHYIAIKVGKYNENEEFDAYLQIRYLNCETGDFLQFTKTIIQTIPNQYDYFEKIVNL